MDLGKICSDRLDQGVDMEAFTYGPSPFRGKYLEHLGTVNFPGIHLDLLCKQLISHRKFNFPHSHVKVKMVLSA